MLQTCGFGKLFHSKILSSCVTQVDELKEVILLLYIQGISTRKVKNVIGKLLGQKGLSHQNVVKITNKLVEEFNSLKKRDLLEQKIVYLILDGTKLAVRANTKKKKAVMGLNEPIIVVIDGCPGLEKAVKELFSNLGYKDARNTGWRMF